jgi:hypothetical protein
MDPLEQRAGERKIYEEVVEIIVDLVCKEFPKEEAARLRIYTLIADNFHGMVKVLSETGSTMVLEEIENG